MAKLVGQQQSPVKAVLFDFYGVVCTDTTWQWLRKNVADITSTTPLYEQILRRSDLGQIDKLEFYKLIAQQSGYSVANIKAGIASELSVNQPVLALISSLKDLYRIGLITNSGAQWIREALVQYDLERLFDDIVISADVGFVKPQPEIYELALKRLQIKPPEAVFIDDRLNNVQAAESLGITSLVFKDASQLKADFKQLQILS